jgi:hypothetical protein
MSKTKPFFEYLGDNHFFNTLACFHPRDTKKNPFPTSIKLSFDDSLMEKIVELSFISKSQ